LHNFQELHNDLGGRTDKNLSLTTSFSVDNVGQAVGQNRHQNHLAREREERKRTGGKGKEKEISGAERKKAGTEEGRKEARKKERKMLEKKENKKLKPVTQHNKEKARINDENPVR
jgi:hypothetical protein